MLRFDLHCHSHFSDGAPSVADIEAHCQELGIGVALTDHNEIRGALQLHDRGKIPCLLATEVGTREGFEFLAYFKCPHALESYFRQVIEPYLLKRYMVRSRIPTDAVLESAANFEVFLSLAHPFALGRKSIRSLKHDPDLVQRTLDQVPALERFNGALPKRWNNQAEVLLQRVTKKFTVGSDAHRLRDLGTVQIELKTKPDNSPGQHFEALRDNRFGNWEVLRRRVSSNAMSSMAYKHVAFFLTAGRSSGRTHPRPVRRS